MKNTEYLTGYDNTRYMELLAPLAEKRINDMQKLLRRLRMEAKVLRERKACTFSVEKRYKEVDQAIDFWKNLLVEEEVSH